MERREVLGAVAVAGLLGVCCVALAFDGCGRPAGPVMDARAPAWTVHYSPGGGCTDSLVAAYGAARASIYVQAYSFTSARIGQALIAAHARGIRVEVIMDSGAASAHDSQAPILAAAGVPVFVDNAHAIAHNKVSVIDEAIVCTGSFNYTLAAESANAENLLVVADPALARAYLENWRHHAEHSPAFKPLKHPE
jgi:phosphatidylserine/phosphatidylglycerophosphate/cardiolipin synthase-like enzyme